MIRQFNGSIGLAGTNTAKGNVVDVDITAIKKLEYKEDVFAVRTPGCIAITADAINGVKDGFLLDLTVVQIEIAKAVVANIIVQQEEMISVPIKAGDLIARAWVGKA